MESGELRKFSYAIFKVQFQVDESHCKLGEKNYIFLNARSTVVGSDANPDPETDPYPP